MKISTFLLILNFSQSALNLQWLMTLQNVYSRFIYFLNTNKLNIVHHCFNCSLILFGSCSRSVASNGDIAWLKVISQPLNFYIPLSCHKTFLLLNHFLSFKKKLTIFKLRVWSFAFFVFSLLFICFCFFPLLLSLLDRKTCVIALFRSNSWNFRQLRFQESTELDIKGRQRV